VHGAGFMHRDIKPGNIIITAKGAPVLVDFGAAHQEVGGKSRSITRVVTPGYAPIEQYSTRGKQGPWTDIYALGAVATGQYSYGKKRSRWVERAAFLGAVDWVSFDLSPLSTRFSNEDRARQRHMKPRWSARAHQ